MGDELVLSGGTGFIGMELLARYLERGPRRVVLLVRAAGDQEAAARVDRVLASLFGGRAEEYRERVCAVAADLAQPGLGLPRARREELAERAGIIIHNAASVSFAETIEQARAVNVTGTRNMLALAELAHAGGGLTRYAHVSTAYVAGTHAGCFAEADLNLGQTFHNSYEQSKFEAEKLVRAQSALPFTILRPSIVVGDQRNGWTSAFNVIYWPLRGLARGLFEVVPGLPSTPLDVVSVDFVADAIHELCEGAGGIGATYHLTAGEAATTVGEIAILASRYYRRPSPRLVTPEEYAALGAESPQRRTLDHVRHLVPYLSVETEFTDSATRARLAPLGIVATPLREYLGRLLDFATAARWGKHPIARSDAFGAA